VLVVTSTATAAITTAITAAAATAAITAAAGSGEAPQIDFPQRLPYLGGIYL
jgi:hypothetical protein